MSARAALAILLVAGAISACKLASPSENKTEIVTGTIPKGGVGPVHPFTVSRGGEYSLVVTSITPNTNAYFLMTWGQQSGGSCQALQSTTAVVGSSGLAGPIQEGAYCVQLVDYYSQFTTSEEYTLKMWHP